RREGGITGCVDVRVVGGWRDGFFFSSRGRHTRCLSDWSSDVCSSDLSSMRRCSSGVSSGQVHLYTPEEQRLMLEARAFAQQEVRSEERRVGNEGGPRRAASRT